MGLLQSTELFRSPHNGDGNVLAGNPLVLREDLLEALKERWQAYRRALRRCQKRASEPRVHGLRVEARRLLSTLEVLGSLVAHARIAKARKKLKEQLDGFDQLRDTHVQLLSLAEILPRFPELKRPYRTLRRREERLVKPAAERAQQYEPASLKRAVIRIRTQLKIAFAAPSVRRRPRDRIASVLKAAFERVAQLRHAIDPDDAATIHRTRIAFKKYRYMIELLEPLLPWVKPTQMVEMDEYQTTMGTIQDVEVMMATLKAMSKKKKFKEISFDRVQQFLVDRHAQLVRAYLQKADQLFTFWPGPIPRRMSTAFSTRMARV